MAKINREFREGSFKNRSIYVELQNYAFKHRPIEDSDDSRFIGRESVVNKIKSFIQDSSVNSGAYLITGFRGMGKTSVVNKALNEYEPKHSVGRFFVLFAISLLLVLIDKTKVYAYMQKGEFYVLFIGLIVLYVGIKFFFNPSRVHFNSKININFQNLSKTKWIKSLQTRYNKKGKLIKTVISWTFYVSKSIVTPTLFRAKHRWIRNIITILLLIIYFITLMYFQHKFQEFELHQEFYFNILFIINTLLLRDRIKSLFNPTKLKRGKIHLISNSIYLAITGVFLYTIINTTSGNTSNIWLCYLILAFLSFKAISIGINYSSRHEHKAKSTQNDLENRIFQKSWVSIFKRIFSFEEHIVVRINLGKDNLKEKDVLKYIVDGLLEEYKKWKSSFQDIKRSIGFTIPLVLSFICISLIVNQKSVRNYSNNIINEMGAAVYFPSQSVFIIDSYYTNHYTHLIDEINTNDEYVATLKQIVNEDRKKIITRSKKSKINFIKKQSSLLSVDTSSVIKNKIEENRDIKQLVVNRKFNHYIKNYNNLLSLGNINFWQIINDNDFIQDVIKRSEKPYHTPMPKDTLNSKKLTLLIDSINYLNQLSHIPLEGVEIGYKTLPETKYIKRSIAKLLNIIDFYINNFYLGFRRIITYSSPPEKYHSFIPPAIDYIVIMILFLLMLLVRKVSVFSSLGFYIHSKAIKDIQKLKEGIESSIQFEKNANMTSSFKDGSSLFSFKKINSYALLESKDIESKIINILEKCQKIPQILGKPKFIFVFDELDKIEIKSNRNIQFKEDENKIDNDNQFLAKRQEKISHILASLKHFLTNAQSKFIFIAGRDMYDASLAGISDRESSLDSIFHQNKIYINSFYSETSDGAISDISSMIERYICKLLIPTSFITPHDDLSLRTYKRYLSKYGSEIFNGTDLKIIEQQIGKTIVTLKEFIIYITYRCNGSPKKMSTLIDEYIIPELGERTKRGKLYVSRGSQNLHLRFSPNDQYIFSQISYLAVPLFNSTGSHKNEFGDKLLVSSSYILDHLYKHNKFAFSHRNLALTPEIVDITKEPEFRNVLDSVINHRVNNHLRRIRNGLFEYRFNSKIRNEIEMISKISERESAALNFTLDESLRLKRHFNQRLKSISKNHNVESNDFIHSNSYIHMMIGDLHYYDQEYSDSIINYMEALQTLRYQSLNKMPLYNFILYVRNSMKLALSLEKEYVFDSSYMKYASLTNQILEKRRYKPAVESWDIICIKRNEWPLFYIQNKDRLQEIMSSDFIEVETIKHGESIKWSNESNDFVKHLEKLTFGSEIYVLGRVANRVENKTIYNFSNMESFYDFDGKYLIKHKNDLRFDHDPVLQHYRLEVIENIRLLYQPILAKLYILEKSYTKRLTKIDIINAIDEFKYLVRPVRNDKNQYIEADFYNKLGDLLYLNQSNSYLKTSGDATYIYLKSICTCLINIPKSCINLNVILKSNINSIDEDLLSGTKLNTILSAIESFINNDHYCESSILGNSLSDLADHFLSKNLIEQSIKCLKLAIHLFDKEGNYTIIKSLNIKYIRIVILASTKPFNSITNKDVATAFQNSYKNYRLSYNMDFGPDSVKTHYSINRKFNYITEELENENLFNGISELKSYLLKFYSVESSTNDLDEIIGLYLIYEAKTNNITLDWIESVIAFSSQNQKASSKLNQNQKLNLRVSALNSLIDKIKLFENSIYSPIDRNHRFFFLDSQINDSSKTVKQFGPILFKNTHTSTIFMNKYDVLETAFTSIFPNLKCSNSEKIAYLQYESIGAVHEIIKNNLLYGINYTSCTYSDLIHSYRTLESILKSTNISILQNTNFIEAVEEITRSKNNYFINIKNVRDKIDMLEKERVLFLAGGRTYSDFMKKGCYLEDYFNNSQLLFKLAEERYYYVTRIEVNNKANLNDNLYYNLN